MTNQWAFATAFCMCCLIGTSVFAQGDAGGGATGGGATTGGDAGGGTTGNTGTTGDTSTGGGLQGQGEQFNVTDIVDQGIESQERAVFEDLRRQDFVGQRSNNYYHHYSQFNQNALSGVTGGAGGAGGRAGGGGGRGGGGTQNFFTVTRRSIRSRVRATFSSPTVPNNVRSNAYNGRLVKIPGMDQIAGNVRIQVDGRVGRLTGTVKSLEQKNLVERQARLEPGIYQIVNQIRVVN